MDAREDALKAAVDQALKEYDESVEAALQRRDARLREIKDEGGWKQADLVRATGYSRETIRQALDPEIRAQIRERRAAAQRKADQS